jgi:hypothetical protein
MHLPRPTRLARLRTATVLLGLAAVLLPLASCSKTTKKAVDTAVSSESTPTAAPAGSEAPADPSTATAPAPATPGTDSAVAALGSDGVAGLAKDVASAEDPIAASLKTLGISDPKEVKCITDQTKAGLDQTKMMKAMFKCSPDVLSKQAAKSIVSANPEVSEEKATCVAKATFKVILELPDDKMAAAIQSAKLPTELLGDVTAAAKSCGMTEAELNKVLKG